LSSTDFARRVRSGLLNLLLSLIYWLLVTPVAWLKRGDSHSEVAAWKDRWSRAGWHTQEQSTSQREIYRSMS
jgi:hypothetical protein